LTLRGRLARYSYHMGLRPSGYERQHLEHTLPALLESFRLYGGREWRPLWIEVGYAADRRLARVEEALGIPVHAEGARLAIVFPAADLALPRLGGAPTGPPLTWRELMAVVRKRPRPSTVGTVADICRTRLLDGRVDIEGVALRMGVGVRTLQRRLSDEGHCYRDLLGELRIDRACRLLRACDQSVTEIALGLGYEDPAHFTRAFRRATQVAPRSYRSRGRAPLATVAS